MSRRQRRYLVHTPECLQTTLKISRFDAGPPKQTDDSSFQSPVLHQPEDVNGKQSIVQTSHATYLYRVD